MRANDPPPNLRRSPAAEEFNKSYDNLLNDAGNDSWHKEAGYTLKQFLQRVRRGVDLNSANMGC